MSKEIMLNEMAQRVHKVNIKWWQDPATGLPITRNKRGLLALVISELCECLEGERKDLMDDHLPERKMADAFIRLLDFACGCSYKFRTMVICDAIPVDKADALFDIMKAVTLIDETLDGDQISLTIALICFYCDTHYYDLMGAYEEKMTYNAQRADHKHEARLKPGGKQF